MHLLGFESSQVLVVDGTQAVGREHSLIHCLLVPAQ